MAQIPNPAPAVAQAGAANPAPAAPPTLSATLNATTQPDGLGEAPQRGTAAFGRFSMAQALVDKGVMTAEQARAQLAADAAAADAPTDSADAPMESNPLDVIAEAKRTSIEVTGALQEIPNDPLPANEARFYGQAVENAMQRPAPTEAQLQSGAREGMAELVRQHGAEKAQQILANAQDEVRYLTATSMPNLPAILERTGGGNDLFLIARLAERAVARAQRQALAGMKVKRG